MEAKSNISEHFKAIFEDEELDKNSVVRNYRTTASDSKNYDVRHYNLDKNSIKSTDVAVVKNYLSEHEIDELNHIKEKKQ